MSKKICISGYYGFDNFGDETILKILVDELKKVKDINNITVFSSSPQITSEKHGVNSVNSFNIPNVLKEILTCDCLISGGGSLLQDVTSKKSLIYYLAILYAAKLSRRKIIIFAQGIGPINNKVLKALTLFILKKADYITVRDENSLEYLKHSHINAKKCSDPVWNIKSDKAEIQNRVGIQLRNFPSLTHEYIKNLAECINKYYQDKEIAILSLQNKQDLDVCTTLRNELKRINPNIHSQVIENTSDEKVIKDICTCQELIAMRYHACLIAIKYGIKLLPINYDIKVSSLAKDFNIEYLDLNDKTSLNKTFENFVNTEKKYDETKINSNMYNFEELESIISQD